MSKSFFLDGDGDFHTWTNNKSIKTASYKNFDMATNYKKDEIVLDQGSYYLCIQDNIGHVTSNTVYWALIPQGAGASIDDSSLGSLTTTLSASKIANQLSQKANSAHLHPISDVTSLQSTLDGKSSLTHNHAISDVTNLQSTLNGKAPTSHSHTLADITDIDVTNKTNGYALQYDSVSAKFVSKALPTGSGTGATSIGGLSDVDITTTTPIDTNVLTYQSGKWIPKTSSLGAYTVELSRWGITRELPTKHIEVISGANVMCYADSDYLIAHNNIVGINNALIWANTNNYKYVTMPLGSYSLCHSLMSDNDKENLIVINYDNFTFDLNGSTFKVLFDSVKRSPYDMVKSGGVYIPTTATQPYELGNGGRGGVFTIRDCNFATLRNGKLIGDKIDRDFIVQAEKAMESTTGIAAGGNCRYVTVENMDVSLFMADGVSVCYGKNNVNAATGYNMGWTIGDLNPTTGATIASTVRCVSDYIAVNSSTPHFLQGYGSTQGMTALKVKKYTIYMYDAAKVFITKKTTYVLRDFTTTKLTKFVRLVVEESALDPAVVNVTTGGWQMTLNTGYYGSYLTYRNNYIHHNHRGGMSQTLNDTLVIGNHFYNNGEQYDYENNLPGFEQSNGQPFLTRYHINVEDIQGFNMQIIGNKMGNGRIGIAIRSYNCIIENNWFKDCIGVLLYRIPYATVRDNYFDNADFDTFSYDSAYLDITDYFRHWTIEGNVVDGSFSVRGTAIVHSINNNIISGPVTLESTVDIFKDNTFRIEKDLGFSEYFTFSTLTNIDNCIFTKTVQSTILNSVAFKNVLITNSTFRNLRVTVENVTLKNCNIIDSGFSIPTGTLRMDTCKAVYGTYLLKSNYANFPDSSSMVVIANNTNPIKLEFVNCDISSAHPHGLFASYLSANTNANLKLENTKITRTVNNKLGIDLLRGILDFSRSTISSDVTVPTITPNPTYVHKLEAVLTNVSFSVSALTAAPTYGSYALGQVVYNPAPVTGGYIGWVCTAGVYANNITWVANTVRALKDQINSGGYVYEAQNAGTSTGTTPSFPTTVLSTVSDSVGITTWQQNTPNALNAIVQPTTPNGYYYICTTAGTSGGAAPTWSTTSGTTVTDGTVVWTTRQIVTWKNIGTLAVFKSFGLIN